MMRATSTPGPCEQHQPHLLPPSCRPPSRLTEHWLRIESRCHRNSIMKSSPPWSPGASRTPSSRHRTRRAHCPSTSSRAPTTTRRPRPALPTHVGRRSRLRSSTKSRRIARREQAFGLSSTEQMISIRGDSRSSISKATQNRTPNCRHESRCKDL